ncbi:MAG: citrate (Si)-synthase [Dehalococcoidia bacterium]
MSNLPEIDYHIGQEQLDTGLRGYPVGTCWTSNVDPQLGVTYVGYPINELAYLPPESVIYLLFNKHLPDEQEAAAFTQELAERSEVNRGVFDLLQQLPKEGHPMDWLAVAIHLLGMTGKTGDYREDALNLVAQIPVVLAALFRIREGWGALIASEPDRGYAENFVHMLAVPGADEAALSKLLRIYYVLHMDHSGGNLSTFAGKAVASGLADVYQSMASAMNGLAGPRHGLASQDCFAMVREIDSEDEAEVEQKVRDRLASGELLFGFGHAVLRQEDPRAQVEIAVGDAICPDDHYFRVVKALRAAGPKVLKENPRVSNPYPNVDLVSGSLLHAMGLTKPEYYTTLFGWARIAGIGAQIVDERLNFRDGKGVAIYRPRYVAVKQPPQSVG